MNQPKSWIKDVNEEPNGVIPQKSQSWIVGPRHREAKSSPEGCDSIKRVRLFVPGVHL